MGWYKGRNIGKYDDGYRGIWYMNQPSGDEYKFKYSGGLGTYPSNHIPFAVYCEQVNKTFFCYGATKKGSNRLLHAVSYYDHERNGVPRPTILLDKKTDDAHDNPVISIDGEGYIWIFSSSHGLSRPSYIHRSCKPYSVDKFERIQKTNFSYPECWHWKERGFLFLHTIYDDHRRFLRWRTSPDGRQWSALSDIARIEMGHYQTSGMCEKPAIKVGTAFNYHPTPVGLNARTNLYYLETDDFAASWHAKGISGSAHTHNDIHLPLTDVLNPAQVYDYQSEKKLVYLIDLNFDAAGNPIILYIVSPGYESGPKNDPRFWTTAYWNADHWEFNGSISSGSNYDVGCLHVEGDGSWLIIGPTEKGPQPYNPGGEMALWRSSDHGKNWTKERQLTSHSEYNHTYARRPLHAHPEFYAIWADGNPREPSPSRIYFYNYTKNKVCQLPIQMQNEWYSFS